MLKVYNKQNKKEYRAIQWTGNNTIEVQQFGFTGTKNGKQTKVDCQRNAYIKKGCVFERVPIGSFIILDGTTYFQVDEETINKDYIMKG